MKKLSTNKEQSLVNKTEFQTELFINFKDNLFSRLINSRATDATNTTNNFTEKKSKQYLAIVTLATISFLLPELALADGPPDAFGNILTKTTGWVTGSAGKLVTFISLAMAGIMGVAGFPTKYVVGALGTGLLLSSSKTIVEMLF